jgi:hypothetical protein
VSYYQVLGHQTIVAAPSVAPAAKKRARHPKGSDKGGEFIGDDPETPDVNEAFTEAE